MQIRKRPLDSVEQKDARVRKQVIEELGRCYRDDAKKQLLATIESEKNPAIVATALRGLASHQGDAASEAAKDALNDESWGGEKDCTTGCVFAATRTV